MSDVRFNPARPFHVEGVLVPGKGVYSHRTSTAWAVMSPAGELCRRGERDQARLVCEAHNDIHEQGFNAGVAAAEAKAAKAANPVISGSRTVSYACAVCGKRAGIIEGSDGLWRCAPCGALPNAPSGPEVFNG